MNSRRPLGIWAASAAALLAAALPARAGAPPVRRLPRRPAGSRDYKLTVSAGLSENCRMGWIPVHVAIRANKEFEGHLVAVLRPRRGGPVLFEARRKIDKRELTAGSKKDYHFYLLHDSPHASAPHVEVYLEGRRRLDDTLQFPKLTMVSRTKYVVCVVSEKTGVLRGLTITGRRPTVNGQPLEGGYSREFKVAQPDLRALPDKAAGYNGVDFLVLCEAPFGISKLSQPQLEAIVDYARGGGVVVLAASNRTWFEEEALRGLIPPPEVTAASRARAGSLLAGLESRYSKKFGKDTKSIVVHDFQVPGFVLDGRRGFAVGRCGLGTVLLWRLDPRYSAVRNWPGLYSLWADLGRRFHKRPRDDYGSGFGAGYGDETSPIAHARGRAQVLNLARERSVSALLVVFLVVFYLVLVGPVNYFVLRRLDMRALSIVTIPLLSAVFVLLTFAVGYISRGVTTVGRRVTVAVTISGADRAACVTSQSIFPSGSMLVEVGTDGRGLLAPLTKQLSGQQQGAFSRQDEAGFVLERHPLRMWEMAHFHAESVRRLGGSVHLVALTDSRGREDGRYRLRNSSAVQLEDAFIVSSVAGGRYAWIGDVRRGKTYSGQLVRWQQGGGRRPVRSTGTGRAPGLKLPNALVLWLRGKLGEGVSYSVPRQEDSFAAQAATVITKDPRLDARRFSGRPQMLLFARAKEELEPVRLDERAVRGESIDLLVVSAERRGTR